LLDALEGEGVVQRWFPSVYEPETARFGGPEAMAAVHAWFDADTRCWLGLERLRSETGAALTAEALCVTVAHDLVSRAVDGRAEAWDVWQSYAAERGAPTTEGPLVTALPDMRALGERASPAEATTLAEYSAANEALAQALRDAWSSGRLARGLRAVVGTVVLFHFHRHGLSADAHAALASTMARLLVPSPQ
jgi:thiopeptide-type bacteriocin biosynthesis protein